MREDHNLNVRDRDEFFADASGGDLRPRDGSPAIDAGAAALAPKTDLAGTARPQGEGVDVGAFEGSSEPRADRPGAGH